MKDFVNFLDDFCIRTAAGFVLLICVCLTIIISTAMRANRDIHVERARQGIVMEHYQEGEKSTEKYFKVK